MTLCSYPKAKKRLDKRGCIWYDIKALSERDILSERDKQKNRELQSLRDTSKKEFEKSWKKHLTNSKRCDIINKLSRKRGLTQKEAFEWNGILKIEQWTTKRTLENSEQSLNKAKLRIIKEVKKRLKNWKSVFRKLNRIDFKYCNRY